MNEQKVSTRWSDEDLARFRERDLRADALSDRLGESLYMPRKRVRLIARFWGIEFTHEMVEEAERIQNGGGMKTLEGTPRTLGGVFFKLVRDDKKHDKDYLRVFTKPKPKKPKQPTGDAAAAADGGTRAQQAPAPE